MPIAAQTEPAVLSPIIKKHSGGKPVRRLQAAQIQVRNSGLPLIYVNQFGGQDELVFDGGSFILDAAGAVQCRLKAFAEDMVISDWRKTAFGWDYKGGGVLEKEPGWEEAAYTACMIGLRDYMGKNGFKKVLLGISGGVDSALCAAIAADAAGAENVLAVMMPYRWTKGDSLRDAELCAQNLGCSYQSLPIGAAVEAAAGRLVCFAGKGETYMRCPYCRSADSQVRDSRPAEEGNVIRRRRACAVCGGRFTTFERVYLRELTVLKKSGKIVPFNRDKLVHSIEVALRKRAVPAERVEQAVSGIVRQLESGGESEIPSHEIGLLAMEALKNLDAIGYIRFASVYRDFRNGKDFHKIIDEISVPAAESDIAAPEAALAEDRLKD